MLAAIESLLCAVVADGMLDDRHDSNQELMAQGLANIVSPLFGGIAANALEDLYERLQRKGKHLVLSAPHTHPLMVMEKAGFLDKLGRQNVCPHLDAALDRARELLGLPPAVPEDPVELGAQTLAASSRSNGAGA